MKRVLLLIIKTGEPGRREGLSAQCFFHPVKLRPSLAQVRLLPLPLLSLPLVLPLCSSFSAAHVDFKTRSLLKLLILLQWQSSSQHKTEAVLASMIVSLIVKWTKRDQLCELTAPWPSSPQLLVRIWTDEKCYNMLQFLIDSHPRIQLSQHIFFHFWHACMNARNGIGLIQIIMTTII